MDRRPFYATAFRLPNSAILRSVEVLVFALVGPEAAAIPEETWWSHGPAQPVLIGNRTLAVYNLHLESRNGERLRRLQLAELLADTRRYGADPPVVVACH